jgi:hypothetical protein
MEFILWALAAEGGRSAPLLNDVLPARTTDSEMQLALAKREMVEDKV